MSSASNPISPARFAAALESLSISSLYLKVAELQNSIAHLHTSNAALEEYVRQEDDKDCYEALLENQNVIKSMQERIQLIKKEVTETRGLPWQPEEGAKATEPGEGRPRGNVQGADMATVNGAVPMNGASQDPDSSDPATGGDGGVYL